MEYIEFSWIKNKIKVHSRDELLRYCFLLLEERKNDRGYPIWYVFLLMKWAIVFGVRDRAFKPLNNTQFSKILKGIASYNEDLLTNYFLRNQVPKLFQVLHNQQSYLQEEIDQIRFAIQLKLYSSLSKTSFDIEKYFSEQTGLTLREFLIIAKVFYCFMTIDTLNKPSVRFTGVFDNTYFSEFLDKAVGLEKANRFIKLLTLNSVNAEENISRFKHQIKRTDLQTVERSFFVMHPFIAYGGKLRAIHQSIYKYSLNYYIYDYLKTKSEDFSRELGYRIEKYVAIGLDELQVNYLSEKKVKAMLPKNSKLVDFYIPDENIYIECKGIEMRAIPSVNPTDEAIFTSLEGSIFKAYFEQLLSVSSRLSHNKENWGIIITYKEFFWSTFSALYPIGRDKYSNLNDIHLPPENVFIIDIYTWDNIMQIMKEKKIKLGEILRKAKDTNSQPETAKQLFGMHLDEYRPLGFDLDYLKSEVEVLKFPNRI